MPLGPVIEGIKHMAHRIRRALSKIVPLVAVQGFLYGLSVIGGNTSLYIPIMAIAIPEAIILGRALLDTDDRDSRREKFADDAHARVATRAEMQAGDALTRPAQPSQSFDPALQAQVTRVREYQRELTRLAGQPQPALRAERLKALCGQFDGWIKDVDSMALRVQTLRNSPLVKTDMQAVPEAIRKITTQLVNEKDPRVRQSLEQTLIARQSQLQSLEKLQSTARNAEVQLESTVASLGAIYSQALANQGTSQVADYRHLAADVDERVRGLRDELEAIEDVRLDNLSAPRSAT
jgi:hypothetical protein